MHRQTYFIGGILLLGAGLCGILGGALHGTQPGTLEALAQVDLARWRVSHVLIAAAGGVFVVAAPIAARPFAGTAGEGLAMVGAGSLLLGGLGILLVGVLETTGFLGLLHGGEAMGAVAADHAFGAVGAVMASFSAIGGYFLPAAVAAFGLAMLASRQPPKWLAWVGIVAAPVGVTMRIFGLTLPGAAALLPYYFWNAWLAVIGLVLLRLGLAAARGITVQERAPVP